MSQQTDLRILLIDDDEDSFLITRGLLSQVAGANYDLHWISTFEGGLAALRQTTCDACLLDFRLGARDGLELLRQAVAEGCRAPIIMLTGQPDRAIDQAAMQGGAADFLPKNALDTPHLERAIRHALERQQLQEQLRVAKEAAEAASKAKSELLADLARSNRELELFATVTSHDLQEPLRMVSSYVELLAQHYKPKLDDKACRWIACAVDGVARMKRLIDDLLELSRLSTRGTPFALTDCAAIFAKALSNLQRTIQETGAVVTSGPLPTILADATQLAQVLQNLIGNAIKFRHRAPPEVHIAAERQDGQWRFAVRDNGIGIDPQFAEQIFVIFQRLHGRDEYPGTGVGLAICKKVIERHGGRIWVESQPGQGATFYFTIPSQEPRVKSQEPRAESRELRAMNLHHLE